MDKDKDNIKIMLVEDHNIVREGLRRLIEMEPNMTVVAEAGSCQETMENLQAGTDIILLDIKLPDGDGLDLCEIISAKVPGVKFIALTTYDDLLFVKKAMEHGVNGFIPKHASFDDIKSAITITLKDGRYLYPGLGTDKLFNLSQTVLSDPEIEILQLIASGENQKNIAEKLYISLSTLRRRLKGICTKLGVRTTKEAVATAVKKGLIE